MTKLTDYVKTDNRTKKIWSGRIKAPRWRRKAYEVPYARKQRLKKDTATRAKVNATRARMRADKAKVIARNTPKNLKQGGDFWSDVGDFFTKTLPDVASQALPMLLTAL